MSESNINLEAFLENGLGYMSRKLGEAVIAQFGGAENFINKSKAASVNISSGIEGWVSTFDMTNFYDDNRSEILDFAKKQVDDFGHESVACMLRSMNSNIRSEFREAQVVEGLYDTDCEQHNQVAEAMASYVGSEVATFYHQFLENQ